MTMLAPLDRERLDDTTRLSVFSGAVLERDLDVQLQAIVNEAAEVTGFGIALVSLVLRRTQFFRAHVGLPTELTVSRSTDRCLSFCQYVVSSGTALIVEDAKSATELPQALVEQYGIRAYAGEPVYLGQQVAGTLCVLNEVPKTLSPSQRQVLHELAGRVSARLADLATVGVTTSMVGGAMRPVFGEIDNALTSMLACSSRLRLDTADLAGLVDTVRAAAAGEISIEECTRVLGILSTSEAVPVNIGSHVHELEENIHRVARSIHAARLLVAQADPKGTAVAEGIAAADTLAIHITKLIGGVRYAELSPVLRVSTLRVVFISVISIALRVLADELHASCTTEGIEVKITSGDSTAYLTLQLSSPAASSAMYRSVARLVDEHARDATGIAVTATGDGVFLTFSR